MTAECQAQKSGKSKMEETEICEHARNVLKYCGISDEEEIGRIIQKMQKYLKRESQNSLFYNA